MRLGLALATAIAVLSGASIARATPTRWALARSPQAHQDEVTRADAEQELIRHHQEKASPFEDDILRVKSHAPKAVGVLEDGGAAQSSSWYLKLLLARAYHATERWADAATVFSAVIDDERTPDVFRADALADIAIDYARLNRQSDEIEAYELALALDVHPTSRATMLANQAEAFMVKGDISRAIAGYRVSLDALSGYIAVRLAPTTLWSLGVALDQSGDLDGALDSIALARSYDPHDTRIKGADWFFVPEYDDNYYDALGEWLVARRAADTEMRMGAYERTILAWKQFLGRAPEHDHYVPVARARLKRAEKEYADFAHRARTPTPINPAGGVSKKSRVPGPSRLRP